MALSLSRARAALPPLTGRTLTTLVVGGAFGALAGELTMRTLAPLAATLIPGAGGPMSSAPLAEGLLGMLAPEASAGLADLGYALHLVVALALQPLGYAALARPAMAAVWPRAPWVLTAALYGVALWAGALALLRALSMEEGPALVPTETGLTTLWAHLAVALVIGGVWRARMGR